MRLARLAAIGGLAGTLASPTAAWAQLPLAPVTPSGGTATPAFEGWYKNPDGSFSLSFGYFNRNATEVLSIPVGPDNSISPGPADQGQPTYFYPRRHWGVFAVKVPASFQGKLVWTVKVRGQTYSIPGSLREEWQIDALEGEAGSNNTPPVLTFGKTAAGPEARGPGGIVVERTAAVGTPITVDVTAKDDGANPNGRPVPVTLTWFTHQGPAQAKFGTPTARLTPTGGTSSTTVTFSKPGDYMLRVRANDSDVTAAGHSQCCWSNAFVKVRVTP